MRSKGGTKRKKRKKGNKNEETKNRENWKEEGATIKTRKEGEGNKRVTDTQ